MYLIYFYVCEAVAVAVRFGLVWLSVVYCFAGAFFFAHSITIASFCWGDSREYPVPNCQFTELPSEWNIRTQRDLFWFGDSSFPPCTPRRRIPKKKYIIFFSHNILSFKSIKMLRSASRHTSNQIFIWQFDLRCSPVRVWCVVSRK